MKHARIGRVVPAAVLAAAGAGSIGGAWNPSHPLDLSPPSVLAASTKTVKGPVVDTRYGPIQIVLKIKNKKISKVSVGTEPESVRSQFITGQAIPVLVQETLQAQSASIDEVSGATDVSEAYIQSLQSAVKKAEKKHLLK